MRGYVCLNVPNVNSVSSTSYRSKAKGSAKAAVRDLLTVMLYIFSLAGSYIAAVICGYEKPKASAYHGDLYV